MSFEAPGSEGQPEPTGPAEPDEASSSDGASPDQMDQMVADTMSAAELADRPPPSGPDVVPRGTTSDALREVLIESRRLGFLGPGPIEDHVDHARGFAQVIGEAGEVLDLGSGGGLPGLVLVEDLPATRFVLLDAATRRCEFLAWAIAELGALDRVEVVCGRAEELARATGLRGRFPVVVSRSFGAPAVTAECAVGFLAGPGARVLVSEPPAADRSRWPDEGLAGLGLRSRERVVTSGATIQILEMVDELSPTLPRRVGIPAKRPRF